MDVIQRGVSVSSNGKVSFQGTAADAKALLRDMGLELVGRDGRVRSGYLRLLATEGQGPGDHAQLNTGLRKLRRGKSNLRASEVVQALVQRIEKESGSVRAGAALQTYLARRDVNGRVGSQSFIRLLQAMHIDDDGKRISTARLQPGRLVVPDSILQPAPVSEAPGGMLLVVQADDPKQVLSELRTHVDNPQSSPEQYAQRLVGRADKQALEEDGQHEADQQNPVQDERVRQGSVPQESVQQEPIQQEPVVGQAQIQDAPVEEVKPDEQGFSGQAVDRLPIDQQPGNLPKPPIIRHAGGVSGLFKQAGFSFGKKLGSGGNGVVYRGKHAGDRFAIKLLMYDEQSRSEILSFHPQTGKLHRSGEIMAAYLEKSDDPEYAKNLAVVRPAYFILESRPSRMQAGAQPESLLVPRAQIKQFLREHGEAVARGDAVPELHCRGVVLPYLSGGDLSNRMSEGALSNETDRAGLALGGLRTLRDMHKRGLIHRDLKPENTFLTDKGPVFIDTGAMVKRSKLQEQSPQRWAWAGVAGTPAYMHPRLLSGQYGPEVDIHAWALTTLEATYPEAVNAILRPFETAALDWAVGAMRSGRPVARNDRFGKGFFDFLFNKAAEEVEKRLAVMARPRNADERHDRNRLQARQQQLTRLRDESLKPDSAEAFALYLLEQASRPYADWATREQVDARYMEIFNHAYAQRWFEP